MKMNEALRRNLWDPNLRMGVVVVWLSFCVYVSEQWWLAALHAFAALLLVVSIAYRLIAAALKRRHKSTWLRQMASVYAVKPIEGESDDELRERVVSQVSGDAMTSLRRTAPITVPTPRPSQVEYERPMQAKYRKGPHDGA